MAEEFTRQYTPELEVRSGGDGRTVVGIAVPYGRPQYIDSRLTEQFARGAFNQQIRAAGRVVFARGHQNQGGSIIGKTGLMRDDAAGLYGEWPVSRTPLGDETLELIKDGALSDLSVGFREGQNRQLPGGVVERATARLTEVAVVPEGAYGDAATITAVRAEATDNRRQLDQIIAGLPVLSAAADILTRSERVVIGLEYGPDSTLFTYWTSVEGFARYAASPEPPVMLRAALLADGVPAAQVGRLTSAIMGSTPAGRALLRAHAA